MSESSVILVIFTFFVSLNESAALCSVTEGTGHVDTYKQDPDFC